MLWSGATCDPADDVSSVLKPLLLVCTASGVGLSDADAGLCRRLYRVASSLLVVGVAAAETALYLRTTLRAATLDGHAVSHAVAIFLVGASSCVSAGVHLLSRPDVVASFRRLPATPHVGRIRACVVATLALVLALDATLLGLRLAEAPDAYFAASMLLKVVDDLTVLQVTALVALLWSQQRHLNRSLLESFQRDSLLLVSDVRRRHADLAALSARVLGVFGPVLVAAVVKTTLTVVAVTFEAIARLAKRRTSPLAPSTVVTAAIFVQILTSAVKLLSLTCSCRRLASESSRTAILAVELMLSARSDALELEDLARLVHSVATPMRAAGVVTLDGNLLVGVVYTVATYVVILLQFALEEESH